MGRCLNAVVALLACIAAAPAAAIDADAAALAPRIVGWPEGASPVVPPGFVIDAFARDLDGPRSLAVLPNGDVLAAETRAGRVILLRDKDRDGVADLRFVLAEGVDRPCGLLLRRDRLYVASAEAVWSYSFLVGQTRVNASPRKLLELPEGDHDHHALHGLAADPDERRLYVSVGATVDSPGGAAPGAAILASRWDGSGATVVAGGFEAPAAIAFEPSTGRLWAAVEGTEAPGGETSVDRLALGAAVTPLGLSFYKARAFPARYRGGAFIGQQGAWDGSSYTGDRLAFVPFAEGRPAGPAEDFLTGFAQDAAASEVRGRPAGVAVARDGALLVADDTGSVIWRITPRVSAGD